MNKIILGTTIILGLGLPNANAQKTTIKKLSKNQKMEAKKNTYNRQ